jgi:hypothetical protein
MSAFAVQIKFKKIRNALKEILLKKYLVQIVFIRQIKSVI